MNYANAVGFPFVALVGENDMQSGTVSLKNMLTGEQKAMTIEEAIDTIKQITTD